MYIYLDESGQFTKHNHEEYFVVASFTVGDPHRTAKQFRSWIRTKFPRKMRTQSEVKWSATGIDPNLRLRTLRHIAKLDVRIRYAYLLRENIPDHYRKKDRIDSGLLYTNVIGESLELYLPADEDRFLVFCDRRHLKGMTSAEFRKILEARLRPQTSPRTLIQVSMVDSTEDANIQIADWIAGALARYLEKGPQGNEYFSVLKNNILGEGKELFPRI